ncbi:MAG TPA: hypothetical protein VJN71_10790 [Nitrososphaerales archaeon]|nr:hypothetical protein [Nitrososphaerales archaeon]
MKDVVRMISWFMIRNAGFVQSSNARSTLRTGTIACNTCRFKMQTNAGYGSDLVIAGTGLGLIDSRRI